MTALRVALLQQPLVWQDPAANRAHFEALLAPLAGRTDLVVLPETFTTGFSMRALPSGALRHYDKRHLFRLGAEHEHFTPGHEAWSILWRGLRVCPLVCYDLRFPVFSRRRMGLEYELLLYVANWPAARADAWRQLLRARAIENQAYVVGVNRVGADGHGVGHSGDSAAIDFLGRTLAQAGDAPAILNVELDRAPLETYRQKFPAHLDADRFTLEP